MSFGFEVVETTWKTRLKAFWLAWKYMLILALLLLASLTLNYRQWRAAVTAKDHAEATQLGQVLKAIGDVGKAKARDDEAMFKRLEGIADRAQGVRVEYRTITKMQPLPADCRPGAARVEAINRGLGPQVKK